MNVKRLVWLAVGAALLTAPGTAQAQLFANPLPVIRSTPTEDAAPDEKAEKFSRFQIGSYAAIWDFNNIQVFRNAPQSGTTLDKLLEQDHDLSPLITADYHITRDLSIGGWWNPGTGTFVTTRALGGGLAIPRGFPLISYQINFWNAHLTYHVPERMTAGFLPGEWGKGWSLQGGFTAAHYDMLLAPGFIFTDTGTRNRGTSLYTPNVWISKSHFAGAPRIGKSAIPINLFFSGGYYTSTDFNNAWNILGGVSIGDWKGLSVNASYWLNDVGGDNNSRISVGISKRY